MTKPVSFELGTLCSIREKAFVLANRYNGLRRDDLVVFVEYEDDFCGPFYAKFLTRRGYLILFAPYFEKVL